MIALLRSRWLMFTVVAPLAAWLLSVIGGHIEQRSGPNSLTRALRWPRERRHGGREPAAAA